jgi:uncharacterized protein YjdB
VAAINVSPTSGTIGLNGQQTFTATAQDASGKTLNATFTWASSATNIATIDGSGVATGHSAGTVQITASVGNVTSAAVPLTVINASIPVASVTLSPISATIQVGQSEQFTATAVDTSGNTLSGAPITWHNSAAGVAVVSTSGMATGISPGTAIITAAVGNVSSPAATLTVTGP